MKISTSYFNIITLVVGLLLTLSTSAQEISELTTQIQKRAEKLAKSNPDSTFLLLAKVEKTSSKSQLKAVKTVNNWLRAKTMYLQKKYDSTLYYGELAIKLGKEVQDYHTLSAVHNLLGVLAKKQRNFKNSLLEYDLSLRYSQKVKDSTTWAKALQNIGNVHRQLTQPDSALFYYEASIAIKERLDDPLSTAKTILNQGNYYFSIGTYKKAIDYYKRALPFYHEGNYAEGIGRLKNNLGASYYKMGFYTLSAAEYVKGLSIYDSLQLQDSRLNTLINLGVVLKELGNTNEANDYYQQALANEEAIKDDAIKATIYLNLGEVEELNNDWTDAVESFKNAAQIYADKEMIQDLSEAYHGLARAYAGLNNNFLAEKYFQLSLDLKREIGDELNIGSLHASLAVFQYEKGEYVQALRNYRQGLQLARKFELPRLSRANLLGLSEVYEALGNPARALSYRQQYQSVKDSLNNVEKSRQIAELQEQYESVQKDKQISELALENSIANSEIEKNEALAEKQSAIITTYLVAAIALLVLILVLFIYYRQRLSLSKLREKEEQAAHKRNIESLLDQQRTKNLESRIAGEEQERKRLAKDLHDHLGSILATVKVNLQGIFEREKTLKENEQVQTVNTLVDKACHDVRGIAHNLHMGISETFGLNTALEDLAASVSGANGIKVQFTASNYTERLETSLEIFVYRMVQEFLSNALRHSEANLISIQLTCLDDLVSIIVEDNGKGFDSENKEDRSSGIGLQNLMTRIEEFEGEISIDSTPGKGTIILVDLPLTTQEEII